MLARRPLRSLSTLGALLVSAGALGACGTKDVSVTVAKKVDPAPAEQVLRSYLDNDRCDLLSDKIAGTIAPDPEDGRRLCTQGQLPVDALVRRGDYKVTDAEVIDGSGLFTIKLRDGGTRDYVLTPGGDDGFQIDSVKTTSVAKLGEPLLLQARPSPTAPAVQAVIKVRTLERIPTKDLSADEFVSYLNHYYRVRVRVHSLSSKPIEVGSLGFTLAQKNGVEVAQPVAPFSSIGPSLPTTVPPNGTVGGNLFYMVPSEKIAKPNQVFFTMGSGTTGAKLIWAK